MSMTKIAISSPSLGQHPSHALDDKIKHATQNGFTGIEVVYADLKTYARTHQQSLLQAAQDIQRLCQLSNMTILSLAPFENFEGANTPLVERLEKAKHWTQIASKLGAKYLQVPAQYDEACRPNNGVVVSDLQQLADFVHSIDPTIGIAYEPMSWSVHNSTWEDALNTINAVNRDNFGLCIDSFHIITKLWASPFEPSGKFPNAEEDLSKSLERFKTQFPTKKLFYVQLSDGERFDPPFSKDHPWYSEGEAPEFTWSKHARPFPLEVDMGGYMPVTQFLKACVVDKGFEGWVSLEIFDRRTREQDLISETAAARGKLSWERLTNQLTSLDSQP